ncbi:18810_t:CDS:2 [Dentiscutata erythropus]|uniref:18810_t:CDS:1 n=1 Tax=Dentiscutata erythropus TaxID=1348616 RepID=A0A9N9HR22_9GLOM|nr:18810_t:CDS:2 [Dentiscutata erythropus]
MVFNLKRIILLVLFALSFAAAHPFHKFESRAQHDRRAPIPLVALIVPTEGAVAQDLVAPTTTYMMATKSLNYYSPTITAIYPTPLLVKEISKNIVPPIGAVAIVKHTFAPINVSEIEAAAVLIPVAAVGGIFPNANPLFPFNREHNKHQTSSQSHSTQSSSTTSSTSSTTTNQNPQSSNDNNDNNNNNNNNSNNVNANSSVLQAAVGIGVGLAGVSASKIFIQHHGPSDKFVDPDDKDTTKSSTREPDSDTIYGSQAASTSMVDLGQDTGQDTVGSVGMERHHSD